MEITIARLVMYERSPCDGSADLTRLWLYVPFEFTVSESIDILLFSVLRLSDEVAEMEGFFPFSLLILWQKTETAMQF